MTRATIWTTPRDYLSMKAAWGDVLQFTPLWNGRCTPEWQRAELEVASELTAVAGFLAVMTMRPVEDVQRELEAV